MGRLKRSYDPEFKLEAIRLYQEGGRTMRSVEQSLGITSGVLKGWIAAREQHSEKPFIGSGNHRNRDDELEVLRRENDRLRRERDILKKAVAIFSTDPNRYTGS